MSLLEIADKRAVLLILVIIASSLSWGCIDSPGDGVNVITIGSTNEEDQVSDFSGSGPTRDGRTKPTVVAPGEDVISTVPPGLENLDYIGVYYAKHSGTSLSTPVAAGVAALLLQAERNLTPAGVKAAMTNGARRLNTTQGEEYEEYYQGAGLIDANRSYARIGGDLCGVMPTRWNAGKWAFRSGGNAISPEIEIGADRPIKKLYALAPTDQDWTTKFTFFTDRERRNITSRVTGRVSEWTNLQPLPSSVPANGQEVFGATITVPEGARPGTYNGSIEILEAGRVILTIPVTAQVAEPLVMDTGRGSAEGTLIPGGWHYYYTDVPLGTSQVSSSLHWTGDSSLDLFFLAPTSEYYEGERKSLSAEAEIPTPPSGRWLVAVHAREMDGPEDYTLYIERSSMQSSPRRWNAGSLSPGKIASASFTLRNMGPALDNMTYKGVLENNSTRRFGGAVEDQKKVDREISIPEGVRRMAAVLRWRSGESDLALRLYDPSGDLADSSDGYENEEEVSAADPNPGRWRVEVFGYSVPSGRDQAFDLDFIMLSEEEWSWVSVDGPESLQSNSTSEIEARLSVPRGIGSREYSGQISIEAGNESFQIPVTVMVSGAEVLGLGSVTAGDPDGDGYYNDLNLSISMDVGAPGRYRLEGGLLDCSGEMIQWLTGEARLDGRDNITLLSNGSDIWKAGGCGPMRIDSLFLYNDLGQITGRYDESIAVDLDPKSFQPPAAYLNGSVEDQSTSRRIRLAVGLNVVKPGSYGLSGALEDDEGEELGKDSIEEDIEPGNASLVLDFNPTKFIMLGRPSRIYLTDLSLTLDGKEIEHVDLAWESDEEIDPEKFGFKKGDYTKLGGSTPGGSRQDDEVIVIG